jgi:ATP diphosphatase
LQVVYFAQIGTEEGRFDFAALADGIADKMVDRHPHVFGDESRDKSAAQQTVDWEVQKARERKAKGEARTLDGVALGLPALMRAQKLQKRAARVGFDWPDTDQVLDKIVEEAGELAAERGGDPDQLEDEFGDLLFVMVNLGRHMGLDAEVALRRTNAKFIRRFNAVEDALHAKGKTPKDSDLAEMDALWDAAKAAEKG